MLARLADARWLIVAFGVLTAIGSSDTVAQTTRAGGAKSASARATTTPTPLDVTKLRRLKLVEDLRLDGTTEDFSVIGRVAINRNGGVAVPMLQDMQIRIYDANGKRVGTVGRKGVGPGEFNFVAIVSWIGDSLFVSDAALRRATYFGPDLTLLRSVAYLPGMNTTSRSAATDTNYWSFSPFAALANGKLIGSARFSIGSKPNDLQYVHVTFSAPNNFTRIAVPPSREDPKWMLTLGGMGNLVPFAFFPESHWPSDGSRIASLTTDQRTRTPTFQVTVRDTIGSPAYDHTFSVRGVPISGTAADSGIYALYPAKPSRAWEGPPPTQWRALAKKNIPAVFSPVERIAIGHDGRAWITMRPTPSGQDVLVLDARGTPMAVANLPPRSRIEQATSSNVWMTQRDEDGLPSVVRYRITK